MAVEKVLVQTKALKTNLLKRGGKVYAFYSKSDDTFIMQIVPPQDETIIHFLDDENVSLIYEAISKEIVGIQIEAFRSNFLPKHSTLEKVWNVKIAIEDFGELLLNVEDRQPQIAREVFKASAPAISQNNYRLAQLFQKSFHGAENYSNFLP
jgi:hypothetical protein